LNWWSSFYFLVSGTIKRLRPRCSAPLVSHIVWQEIAFKLYPVSFQSVIRRVCSGMPFLLLPECQDAMGGLSIQFCHLGWTQGRWYCCCWIRQGCSNNSVRHLERVWFCQGREETSLNTCDETG
jgi:hypothetical protein